MRQKWLLRLLFAAVATGATTATAGCGAPAKEGPPTEAICPLAQTLSYANFGKRFFELYCLGCHSEQKLGADRKGAPPEVNWDTLEAIQAGKREIDKRAAAGPRATNQFMPDESPRPTMMERLQLGEWLACGAPQ